MERWDEMEATGHGKADGSVAKDMENMRRKEFSDPQGRHLFPNKDQFFV